MRTADYRIDRMKGCMAGKSTPQLIVEAAEQVFARRGYDGGSIREICSIANVNTGSVVYHFGTKDSLFDAVIELRRETFLTDFAAHMISLEESSARGVLQGYIGFLFDRFSRPEWHDYVRVLAKSASAYDVPAVRSNLMKFDIMPSTVQALLQKITGSDDAAFLRRIVLYAEATMTTLFISDFLLDRRIGTAMDDYVTKVVTELSSIMASALPAAAA